MRSGRITAPRLSPLVPLALVLVILASAIGYAARQVNQVVSRYVPLADAAMQIEIELTQGHLWFEEILSGDREEDLPAVWGHYEAADRYARVMLEGGAYGDRQYRALEDADMRRAILQVRRDIAAFRTITERRLNTAQSAYAGSEVDREYDAVFRSILDQTGGVGKDLRLLIESDVTRFHRVMLALVVIALMGGLVAGWIIQQRTEARRRVESTLRKSEEKFATAFAASPLPMVITAMGNGRLLEANQSFSRTFGSEGVDQASRAIARLDGWINPQDRVRIERQLKEKGAVRNIKGRWAFGSTEPRWVRFSADIIEVGGEKCLLSVAEDINESVRAKEEILASREHLRALTTELSTIEEQERRRIASFLHDQLGQSLAVVRMKFGALKESSTREESHQLIGEIQSLLEQSIEDTSTLTFELSPPILYELGIEAAVEWLGTKICEENGLVFHFLDDGREKSMEADLTPLMFRITQEMIMNVVKHAAATNLYVEITREGPMICIAVEDDGVGFDLAAATTWRRPGGYGLYSIRERTQFVGGRFCIGRREEGGTRACACAPLAENALERGGA